ncbi:efflux transporter periplasmic adaptor subunit [Paenibacillus sp. CAA11]|uniref:efflux RND transporter periplasmic adaptor subunit n=1 Tax=Paenibacillus sp. CAA11 TaxID=1532905 RepID=UPI000D344364|nr:HlyD family efflux transporter periplasmic adaptor subunit [Paenibacillus sp. CAA11]AWB45338.1 efflux transporter periplasmic adaptor subunit [Paenibacillus sp. CAA11]
MFTKWLTEDLFKKGGHALRRFGFISLAAVVLLSSGCGLLPKEEEEEALPEIKAPTISKKPEYDVTTGSIENSVNATGKMMSQREEPIFFTEDGLHIKDIKVKAGDKVAKGDTIAVLDVEDLQKDLRKKRLEFRKQEVTMKENLRKKDEMEPVEFEEASIVFEEARQEIADLEAKISKGVLTAPFGGTILSVNVEKGATVKAYDPIATIADTSNLVVAASFSKEDLEKLSVGMKAKVDINGVGTVNGKIKVMPLKTDESTTPSGATGGTGTGAGAGGSGNGSAPPKDSLDKYLIVQLDKMPKGLNRGTPLSVTVVIQRKDNVILIPISALRSVGSRNYVQVVESDGSKKEVDVEVGQQTPTQIEIIKGLTPGQKVVGQ